MRRRVPRIVSVLACTLVLASCSKDTAPPSPLTSDQPIGAPTDAPPGTGLGAPKAVSLTLGGPAWVYCHDRPDSAASTVTVYLPGDHAIPAIPPGGKLYWRSGVEVWTDNGWAWDGESHWYSTDGPNLNSILPGLSWIDTSTGYPPPGSGSYASFDVGPAQGGQYWAFFSQFSETAQGNLGWSYMGDKAHYSEKLDAYGGWCSFA